MHWGLKKKGSGSWIGRGREQKSVRISQEPTIQDWGSRGW